MTQRQGSTGTVNQRAYARPSPEARASFQHGGPWVADFLCCSSGLPECSHKQDRSYVALYDPAFEVTQCHFHHWSKQSLSTQIQGKEDQRVCSLVFWFCFICCYCFWLRHGGFSSPTRDGTRAPPSGGSPSHWTDREFPAASPILKTATHVYASPPPQDFVSWRHMYHSVSGTSSY